jgi:hypothetical protein
LGFSSPILFLELLLLCPDDSSLLLKWVPIKLSCYRLLIFEMLLVLTPSPFLDDDKIPWPISGYFYSMFWYSFSLYYFLTLLSCLLSLAYFFWEDFTYFISKLLSDKCSVTCQLSWAVPEFLLILEFYPSFRMIGLLATLDVLKLLAN